MLAVTARSGIISLKKTKEKIHDFLINSRYLKFCPLPTNIKRENYPY